MKKICKLMTVAIISAAILSCTEPSVSAQEQNNSVYIGGDAFGVRFYANGVVVTELEDFYDGAKYVCPARSGGLRKSDVIKEADGYKITCNEDLQAITQACSGKTVKLKIERNGKEEEKKISPIKNTAGAYLIGAWIRDSCAGIGTVTYYDVDNNYFAALGHGICDSDTGALMPLAEGEVLKAEIIGINKSTAGKAGSLSGYFTDTKIGRLSKNGNLGIFGNLSEDFTLTNKKYETASINEVKTGGAQIYTTVENSKPEFYDAEIKRICSKDKGSNENFIIEITDKGLLNKTGGIVQGMSGSPIVQNGKLVGAVTHVFVNNPKEGYGVFLQNMVDYYNL